MNLQWTRRTCRVLLPTFQKKPMTKLSRQSAYLHINSLLTPSNCKPLRILFTGLLLIITLVSVGQTTYDFSVAPALSNQGNYYTIQALVTIDGVSYKLTHLGNGSFSYLTSGGSSNSACLKKDGSGGDFLKIERADGAAFQFYGMWLNTSSMYNPPFYQPPYYNIKYYDENNAEIVAETFTSNVQNETITVSKNLKVKYVNVTFNAILFFKLDNLVTGPAAASAPTITTTSVSQFSSTTAVEGGNVTADGGAAVTERGVVYNTTGSPTTADNKIVIGSGTGSYSKNITGLSSNTMYYVKSYATNSAGTTYGTQASFTTAADFVLSQIHYFNSSWVSTTGQATPYTKYVEGWNITATGTGTGLVAVSRITGVTGVATAAEGTASARASSSTSAEDLVSMKVTASDNSMFDLQSFKFKYLTKIANTSFGTIIVTGYRNSVAVPGAVASLTGIGQATASSYAYSTFDLTGNANFNSIDEFVITASNSSNAARLSAIDIDVLNVQPPVALPLTLTGFTGKLKNNHSVLSWNTSLETNTSHFDIEHSADGVLYNNVGSVKAAGNSQLNRAYTFTHESLAAGNNYYRLKMVDANGRSTYSPIVNIEWVSSKAGFSVYPNPVSGDHCFIMMSPGTTLPLSYRLVNVAGKIVQTGVISINKQKLELSQLTKGNYYLVLSNGQSQKIVF
jgi:hypothetical protein